MVKDPHKVLLPTILQLLQSLGSKILLIQGVLILQSSMEHLLDQWRHQQTVLRLLRLLLSVPELGNHLLVILLLSVVLSKNQILHTSHQLRYLLNLNCAKEGTKHQCQNRATLAHPPVWILDVQSPCPTQSHTSTRYV